MPDYWDIFFFALLVWLSGWIPHVAIFLLRNRKIPVFPSFFCLDCKSQSASCDACKRALVYSMWKVRVVVLVAGIFLFVTLDRYEAVFFFVFLLILIFISVIDLWSKLIPNVITYPLMLFVFFLALFHLESFINHVITMLLTIGILFLFSYYTHGIGGGDIKLLGVLAMLLGFPNFLVAFWIAICSACFYIICRQCYRPLKRKDPLPFAPHITIGCYVSYLWGSTIVKSYLLFLGFAPYEVLSLLRIHSLY